MSLRVQGFEPTPLEERDINLYIGLLECSAPWGQLVFLTIKPILKCVSIENWTHHPPVTKTKLHCWIDKAPNAVSCKNVAVVMAPKVQFMKQFKAEAAKLHDAAHVPHFRILVALKHQFSESYDPLNIAPPIFVFTRNNKCSQKSCKTLIHCQFMHMAMYIVSWSPGIPFF